MEAYILPLAAATGGALRSIYGYLVRKADKKNPTKKFDFDKFVDSVVRGGVGGFIFGSLLPVGGTFMGAVLSGFTADVAIKEGIDPLLTLLKHTDKKKK